MKKIIAVVIVLIGFSYVSIAQNDPDHEKQTGYIYFLRATGFQGSASAFKVFIDEEFVCKLNNKMYSIHEVPVGNHTCSVQFGGKKSKKNAEKFEVTVEPGKNVYMRVVFESGVFKNNTYCEEITESSAKRSMNEMTQDTDCK